MKEKVLKNYLKYISLNIFAQIMYSCFSLCDTFFISFSLGADGLTALNLAFPIYCFINGIACLLGVGGGIKFTIYHNQKDDDKANKVFTHSLYLALIISVIFMLLGLFLSREITSLLGASNEVIDFTSKYIKVLLLFTPIFLLNQIFHGFIRNDNNPKLSMIAMSLGGICGIGIDCLFIIVLKLNMVGAALSFGLSSFVSLSILSIHLFRKKNNFHLQLCKPSFSYVKDIILLGFASFLTELTSGVVMLLFNFIILSLKGDIGVASYSVISVISLTVVSIFNGLALGLQPLLAKSYALNDKEESKYLLLCAYLTAFFLAITIYLILFFLAGNIVSIFNSDNNAELQELATLGIKLYFIATPMIGFNIVSQTYFASSERSVQSHIISLSRGFIVLTPCAFLFSYLFKMTGCFLSFPISETVVFFISVILLFIAKFKSSNKEKCSIKD